MTHDTHDTLPLPIERLPFGALPREEWAALVRDGYHGHYSGMGEMYGGVASVEDKIRQIVRWGEGILAWTARDEGRLVGLLTGDLDDGHLTVYDFFVAHSHRRRGVGRALLEAALAEPGLRAAAAEINLDNAASRALFESEGFRLVVAVGWFVRGPGEG
jgi:ribosomal protein S18 acetylase RimI-like enzyme